MNRTLFTRWSGMAGALLILAAAAGPRPARAQADVADALGRTSPLTVENPTWGWQDNRDPDSPRPSPNAVAGLQVGSTRILITYGSPGARGRKIFGRLVPYGRLWRTGANEATTITFTDRVQVEGLDVLPGTYSLFTLPGPETWTVVLNRINNQWGQSDYDPEADVLRVTVPRQESAFTERLTFGFEQIDTDAFSAAVVLRWETTKIAFSIVEP